MSYQTEQETFWSGEFGNDYIERNGCTKKSHAAVVRLYTEILSRTGELKSMIELGANIGNNLKAVRSLLPDIEMAAVEINHKAASLLKEDPFFEPPVQVLEQSILDFAPVQRYDLALISGVLIHIHPDQLQNVYEKLYQSSKKYICITEYYNPTPVEVPYRGHAGRLFKRDFAGEFLDRYPDCRLVDYGFVYHRDPVFPLDDATWFLICKTEAGAAVQ